MSTILFYRSKDEFWMMHLLAIWRTVSKLYGEMVLMSLRGEEDCALNSASLWLASACAFIINIFLDLINNDKQKFKIVFSDKIYTL